MHNCNFDNHNDNESIYDRHETNIRAYEQNPVQIVEKFDNQTYDVQHMLKWVFILLIVVAIVYLVYYICCNMQGKEKIVTVTYTPLSYDSSSFNLFK